MKQNNRRHQCSLSAATTFTGHAGFVYVAASEKAKEAKQMLSCLLKGAAGRPLLQSNSQDGSGLNLNNHLDLSQALERMKDGCWCSFRVNSSERAKASLFSNFLLRHAVQEICPL